MNLIVLVTLLNKKLYTKQIWLVYYLIFFFGQFNNFYIDNCFRKIIIKLCKEKVRLLSNIKSDQFLQKVVILNILLLYKIKKVIAHITKSISYGNYHFVVNNISDLRS